MTLLLTDQRPKPAGLLTYQPLSFEDFLRDVARRIAESTAIPPELLWRWDPQPYSWMDAYLKHLSQGCSELRVRLRR